jgi:flavorubredoxin
MPEVSKSNLHPKDIDVIISEIHDGIYRIAGFVQDNGITFNQFLIDDEQPSLIHTGPVGMYKKNRRESKRGYPIGKINTRRTLTF